MRRRFLLLMGLAVGFSGAATLPAQAEDISGEAQGFVQQLGDRAIQTISEKDLSEGGRKDRFRSMFLDAFDVPAIGQFVLGRYWRTATDTQKSEFLKLFQNMVVQTYASRFSEYSGETFKVASARSLGDDQALVTANVIRPQSPGQPIKVEWRVLKTGGKLKIVDVIVEGVSMSTTQQQEFASVIQRSGNGVDGLLATLRERFGTG